MDKNLCTIYLVRHGQSEGNVVYEKWIKEIQKTKYGTVLSDLGKEQAKLLAKKFKNIRFDAIFSSHLHRARQTAEIIAREKKMAVIAKEVLQERIKGKLGGKSAEELKGVYIHGDFNVLTDSQMWKWRLFPDMETAEEAVSRFITALREIALAYPGKKVLVVSHGFVMRALLIHLGLGTFKQFPPKTIDNTGYLKLESDGVDFFVKEMVGIHPVKLSPKE